MKLWYSSWAESSSHRSCRYPDAIHRPIFLIFQYENAAHAGLVCLTAEVRQRCTLHAARRRFSSNSCFVYAIAKLWRWHKMQRDVHGYNITTIAKACFGIDRRTVAHAANTVELERKYAWLWAINALESIVGIRTPHCGHKNE